MSNENVKNNGRRILEIVLGVILVVAAIGVFIYANTSPDVGGYSPITILIPFVIGGILIYQVFQGRVNKSS